MSGGASFERHERVRRAEGGLPTGVCPLGVEGGVNESPMEQARVTERVSQLALKAADGDKVLRGPLRRP